MLLDWCPPSQEQVEQRIQRLAQIQQNNTPPAIPNTCEFVCHEIAVINQSTVVSSEEFQSAVDALQIQLNRDWYPMWRTTAQLIVCSPHTIIPAHAWRIQIQDSSDVEGALGYHEEDMFSTPQGLVFAKDSERLGLNWTVTFSHELLEIMANPWVNLTVFDQTLPWAGRLYAYESCDAVQNDAHAYEINGVQVSNFQYPAWFDVTPAPGAQFDYQNLCTRAFEILPGGYMPVYDVSRGGGWSTIHAHMDQMHTRVPGMQVRDRISRTSSSHSPVVN
jgi:hypothetical protein